jgi:mannose-1-phosphate guanylyltransferase
MVLHGIIMAGGSGTRFWPYSRTNYPKQMLKIFSKESMIQDTINRLKKIIGNSEIYISTTEFMADIIKKEVSGVKYIAEPVARNTAACIGLSAITILKHDPEGIMIIETSDHLVKDVESYSETMSRAVDAAKKDKIVLLGIKPRFPHTGYGYINVGNPFEDIPETYYATKFMEKPDVKTAKLFLESGDYLWNSGIFIAKASVMLDAIQKNMPSLYSGLMKIKESKFDKKMMKEVFEGLESISIDYGVMEKCDNKVIVMSTMDWDDLGDFLALERWFSQDDRKNTILCDYEGNAVNCIVLSQRRKVIAKNTTNLIIVDTEDATLICDKDSKDMLKKAIEKIKEAELTPYLEGYVQNYQKGIISLESEECELDTNGLIVVIGVSNIEVKRSKDEIYIEGAEEDVELE